MAALSPPATGPLSPPGALTRPCFVTTVSLRWNRGAPGGLGPIRRPSRRLQRASQPPAGGLAPLPAGRPGPLLPAAGAALANDLTLSCIGQLSRWKRTIRPVVRYNCYVNLSADDAELVQLLGQLLRVVSPESAGPGHGGSGLGNGGPRPGGGQARPDGVAGDGSAIPDPGERDRPAGAAAEPSIPALSASEARALIELVAARGIAQGQLGTLLGLEKSTGKPAGGRPGAQGLGQARPGRGEPALHPALSHPRGQPGRGAGLERVADAAGPDPRRAHHRGAHRAGLGTARPDSRPGRRGPGEPTSRLPVTVLSRAGPAADGAASAPVHRG